MSAQTLFCVAQIALLLATVAYCGSKMHWRPQFLFQAAAHVSVFAAVVVLGLLCVMGLNSNLPLLKSLVRRLTGPLRNFVGEFLIFL